MDEYGIDWGSYGEDIPVPDSYNYDFGGYPEDSYSSGIDFNPSDFEFLNDYDFGDGSSIADYVPDDYSDYYGGASIPAEDYSDYYGGASIPAEDYSDYYGGGIPEDQLGTYIDPARLAEFSQYNVPAESQTQPTIYGGPDEAEYTSGWQNLGTDRAFVNDDGTTIVQNTETGEVYTLNPNETATLIQRGVLNTRASGYYEATGGSNAAPGGGTPVTLNNGQKGTLMVDGRVIDSTSGRVIGDSSQVRGGVGTTSGNTGGISTLTPQTQTKTPNMASLLPLLLLMMAMNKGGGGGGKSSALIPALTATQKQTPYSQIQQAPGYRPGQGGITYFNPTQYTPRMAAGGIAELSRGRLLDGPGDGVSDSIPAQIGHDQPARLARGEYVMDARTVAALGNGSTDAGAERLDEMRKKILAADRKAGVGKDSKAYRHLKV